MALTIDEYLTTLPAPMISSGDRPRTTGTTAEVCKRIRKELASACDAGVFPAGVTFSVRKDSHKSVTVSIETYPGSPLSTVYTAHLMECIGARMRNEKEPEWDGDRYGYERERLNDGHHHSLANPRLTIEANHVWANASRIANRHNHDYSESQTDYFDVGYYLDVTTHALVAIAERGIRLEMDPQYADLVRRGIEAAKRLPANVVKAECGRMPVEHAGEWVLARLIEIDRKCGGRPMEYDKRRRRWVVSSDVVSKKDLDDDRAICAYEAEHA